MATPKKWQYLMLHHTATGPNETVESIRAMHLKRGFNDIGYHYLIVRKDGKGYLKSGRPDTKAGAHCPGWNSKALGLSVVGYFHPGNKLSEVMSEALYQYVLAAVCHLCKKYNIPASRLLAHREKKATACPGDWFAFARLKCDVERALQ